MQTVSEEWIAEQEKNFVGESYIEIVLSVSDPDAQDAATTTDNGHTAYSGTAYITDEVAKVPSKYATGETNIWALDGTVGLVPSSGSYGQQGYIGSVLSGTDGSFTAIPTVTITFSKTFTTTIPGITITWGEAYEEFADTFRVTVYNGTTVLEQVTIEGNREMTTIVSRDMSGYNKITVEILKWSLPYRRARIKEILLGILKTFTKDDLFSFTHEMTVDPLSAALPKAEITFEVKNLNGEYNPDNPEGAAKYLLTRQMVTARYGYKIDDTAEMIKTGTFYMSEWDLPQNGISARFAARDALEYMNDVYTGTVSGTLYAIATAAFTQAGLPTLADGRNRWTIDSSLQSISAPSGVELNEGITISEVLQYCANAACCVFYQDRSGVLHIEPLASGATDYRIDRFRSYENSDVSLTKQLKSVNVNDGQYVLSVGSVGETQSVSNPFISNAQAPKVAAWVAAYLQNRNTLTGEFRADPRLDALDRVTNENQFSESTVLVTSVVYSYNGAFRGNYEGRRGA